MSRRRRLPRLRTSKPALVLFVAVIFAWVAAVPVGAQTEERAPYLWLAAGDSYSAGEGVGDDAQRCQISLFAYPRQVARGYGDSDDAWAQLFGDTVPPRTSDDVGDIWKNDLGAELVVTGRGGPYRDTTVDIAGRDDTYELTLRTFKDFWEKRSAEQTVDIDQRWAACSGGRVEDLFYEENGRPPQLEILGNDRADLITMSMGGNDLGFGDLINGCLGSGTAQRFVNGLRRWFPGSDCEPTLEDLKWRADYLVTPDDDDAAGRFGEPGDEKVSCINQSRRSDDPLPESAFRCSLLTNGQIGDDSADGLPGYGLVDVYVHTVRKHVREETGNLVIVGYPRFFATRAETDLDGCAGFTAQDIRLLNDGAEYLDQTLREAVATANGIIGGEQIHYLSVLASFDDNGLCGDGEDWLNATNFDTSGGFASDSFHPTRAGHDGMTTLLRAEVEQLCGFRVYISSEGSGVDCGGETSLFPGGASLFGSSSSSTVLVVDVSDSMNDPSPVGRPIEKIVAAVQASQDLISVVEVDAGDGFAHSVGVVAFNGDAALITRATSDLDGAKADVANLIADGNTDVGAGLSLGIDTVLGNTEARRIVLLSDGDITDGLSQNGVLAEVVPRSIARGIPIDVIGFASEGSLDEVFLQEIATRSGGTLSIAASAQELRQSFIRARHAATGTVVVDVIGGLDPGSDEPLADFDVPLASQELVVSLGHESNLSNLRPVLYDPLGRPVPDDVIRIVGTNPVTVAVSEPLPGRWSVYVNETDEAVADAPVYWSPPIDGGEAGALIRQSSAGDGDIPYVLVVSTRGGATADLGNVNLTPEASLPWLAAGVAAAVAALVAGSIGVLARLAVVGARPGTGQGNVSGGFEGRRGGARRWLHIGLMILLTIGFFFLVGVMIGGLDG